MTQDTTRDLKIRIKQFSLRIIRLYTSLPKTTEVQIIGRQVLNSGTSIGTQYREAQRAKSDADFISKLKTLSRNWMKQLIGLNCSEFLEWFRLKRSIHL